MGNSPKSSVDYFASGSLEDYQGEGYSAINKYSRDPHYYDSYTEKEIDSISKSMKTRKEWVEYYKKQGKEVPFMLQARARLFRGFKQFDKIIENNKKYCDNCIIDNGFSSSTYDIAYTQIFIDRDKACCVISFSLPDHIKFYPYGVLSRTSFEAEFLLERYLKFNINPVPVKVSTRYGDVTVYDATVERVEDWIEPVPPSLSHSPEETPSRSRSPRTKPSRSRSKPSRSQSRSMKPSRSRFRSK